MKMAQAMECVAEKVLRPDPKMSGPAYRTIGPESVRVAHESIKKVIDALPETDAQIKALLDACYEADIWSAGDLQMRIAEK